MKQRRIIMDIHPALDKMLNKKTDEMMLSRSAVIRLAIKTYCEDGSN